MKKKIIIGAVVIGIFAIIYLLLGGAEEIIITKEKTKNYAIVGMDYNGRYRGKELREKFADVKNKLDSGTIEGVMVVVNYNIDKDSLDNGFIKQFIGIQLTKGMCLIFPKGYSVLEINTKEVINVHIGAHNLVMPSPEKIEQKINAFALQNGLTRMNLSIEKYVSERELNIEVPLLK